MLVCPILALITAIGIFHFDNKSKNKLSTLCIVLTVVFLILTIYLGGFYLPEGYKSIESYTYSVDSSLTTTVTITNEECGLYEKDNKIYIKPDDWNWEYYFIPLNDEMYEVKINGDLLNIKYPDSKIVEYKKAPSVEEIAKGE